jgi:DNA-binding response OmpR family regulator
MKGRQSMTERTIVVVEDDHNISDLLDLYLRRDGFRVLQADSGEVGLDIIGREHPVMVILDIGLPGIDGLEVCRRLRAGPATAKVPVLFLTARDDELDRIIGLELGADDYVTKPFSPREIVARVKAILRRVDDAAAPKDVPTTYCFEALAVDLARREVRVGDAVVALATREFDLLAHLAANAGIVRSRAQLLASVWGPDWYGDERTVDVHVRQLRRKIGDALPLATVWGVGYRFG